MEPDDLQSTTNAGTLDDAMVTMTDEVSGVHAQGVVAVILAAAAVSLLVRRVGRSRLLGNLRRWLPLFYTSIWALAIVGVTLIYARGLSNTWLLATWLLFLIVVLASVGWLRSVMSGVAISIEGRIKLGDSIRVENVAGEVIGFGVRSMRLRAVDGSIHEIPNDKIVTEVVANLSGDRGDSACELVIAIPDGIDPDAAVDVARRIAILTPLASPRHRPEVFLEARGHEEQRYELRIRGYAFDAAYQDHFRSDVVSRIQSEFSNQATMRRGHAHAPELVMDE